MKGRAVIVKPRRRSRATLPASAALVLSSPATPGAPVVSARVALGDRELQLARALSDTERTTRDAALRALEAWLREHAADVTDPDWDRLCKALFYCIWMADKRPVIAVVVARIVGLADIAGWPFLQALFRCIVREWPGVDRHRVDKFYELVTVALEHAVARTVRADANAGVAENRQAVACLMSALQTEVVDKAARGASGVALHVFDYWLERVLQPLMIHVVDAFPGNEAHRIYDEIMTVPCSILGAKNVQLLALSLRAVDRIICSLPDALAVERLQLSPKCQRDMIKRTMKKVWSAAASKESHAQCRQGLFAAHSKLKAHVAILEAQDGVLPASGKSGGMAAKPPSTVDVVGDAAVA
jgi:hypothetical protein